MSKNGKDGTTKKEGGTTGRKRNRRAEFLVALAESGVVAEALKASGMSRTTAYRHRLTDADFRGQWDEALDVAVEVAEAELYRRSTVGVEEPVFYQGEQVATVRKYSDNLLMFRLKALRPEKYRDAVANTNVTINDERNTIDPALAARMLQVADEFEGKNPSPKLAHLDRCT